MPSAFPLPAFPLQVSENHRFLVDAQGAPFFYLGDTAWELFHRLDREDAETYLQNRANKGFTVIQAVALAEFDGLRVPNAYGVVPLEDDDPARPVEAYFQHVDWIVKRAGELGLVTGLLPTWGDKWNKRWGQGPEIFTPENARQYGEYLGRRYRDAPIIWILGGDRPIDHDGHRDIIDAMAAGIGAGTGGTQLITYHNCGSRGSSDSFHDAPWLDFNTYQSGHDYNRANYRRMAADYALEPAKPCMDAEPGYEDHPANFKVETGYLDDYDVRKFAYWAVFAGAHGHTYGCHDMWQFHDSARFTPVNHPRTPWRQAMDLPGARQVGYLRRLMLSRPYLSRLPAPELILSEAGEGGDHIEATRDSQGAYAFVYLPKGGAVTLATRELAGEQLRVTWLNPRSGEAEAKAEKIARAATGEQTFTAPTAGEREDWVLILDVENTLAP